MKKYKMSFVILALGASLLLIDSILEFINGDIIGAVKSISVSIFSAILSVLYYKSIKN